MSKEQSTFRPITNHAVYTQFNCTQFIGKMWNVKDAALLDYEESMFYAFGCGYNEYNEFVFFVVPNKGLVRINEILHILPEDALSDFITEDGETIGIME